MQLGLGRYYVRGPLLLPDGVRLRGAGMGKTGLFEVSGDCSLTLERLNLVNGDDRDGGAVFVHHGNLTLINSDVTNCKATDWGGALYVDNWYEGYKVRVEGSTFTSCSADKVRT